MLAAREEVMMHARVRTVLVPMLLAACASEPISTESSPQVERVERRGDGVPYFVAGTLGRIDATVVDASALAPALPGIAARFGVRIDELVVTSVEPDQLGMTHVRYAQQRGGLRVVGGDLVVHVGADGVVRSANGTVRDALPSASAVIDGDVAAGIAMGSAQPGVEPRASELVYVIATRDDQAYLAWEVELGAGDALLDRVYVDAQSGEIVDRRPELFTARNRTIFDGNGGTYPFLQTQTQVGTEASPPTDMVALAAYTNTGLTYDCYQALFQRDSYNGAGATLKSLVHVKFYSPNGASGNNAAWNNNQMVYGDGDGQLMGPLALSLDVTAHELTHGVTSTTAKLAYMNESGALNEGMSDIMSAVCEAWHDGSVSADTWLIGEDIFTPAMAGDALRYMANPTADASLYPPQLGGSRDFYPERYQGQEDQGGVHLNSGIPNLAFQLLAAGGKHPRQKTAFMVPGIGIEKAGAIFQRALTGGYFTSNTNLAQARTLTEQVAEELYPGTKAAVGLAWAAVGVGAAPMLDTVPPTVDIVAPIDGAAVAPGFSVDVEATDDVGVVRVDLAIDGTVVGSATAAPYTFTTDAALAVGSHTLTATAYDVFNEATDSITVDVRTACTTDDQCADGESCNAGVCEVGGGSGTGDGGGCCAADSRSSNWWLCLAVMFVLRRRRRR
jgi:Zn-dependent metalloprotease